MSAQHPYNPSADFDSKNELSFSKTEGDQWFLFFTSDIWVRQFTLGIWFIAMCPLVDWFWEVFLKCWTSVPAHCHTVTVLSSTENQMSFAPWLWEMLCAEVSMHHLKDTEHDIRLSLDWLTYHNDDRNQLNWLQLYLSSHAVTIDADSHN